jgi:hypothetical protein
MDPRDRADALLARARARGVFVVTPDDATSPMDAANTQQIPRVLVTELDRDQDPDTTISLSASLIEASGGHHLAETEPTTRMDLPPARRSRSKPRSRPQQAARQAPEPVTEAPEEVGGLVPTKTTSTGRSSLSRRLDGI